MLHASMDALIRDMNANEAARLLILLDDRLTSLINGASIEREPRPERRRADRPAADVSPLESEPLPTRAGPPRESPATVDVAAPLKADATPASPPAAGAAPESKPVPASKADPVPQPPLHVEPAASVEPAISSEPILAVPPPPRSAPASPPPARPMPLLARKPEARPAVPSPEPAAKPQPLDATPASTGAVDLHAPKAPEPKAAEPKAPERKAAEPPPPAAPVFAPAPSPAPDIEPPARSGDDASAGQSPADDEESWIEEDFEDGEDLAEAEAAADPFEDDEPARDAPSPKPTGGGLFGGGLLSRFRLPGFGKRKPADTETPPAAPDAFADEDLVDDDAPDADDLADDVFDDFEDDEPEDDVAPVGAPSAAVYDLGLRRLHAVVDQLAAGSLLDEALRRTGNRIELAKVPEGLDLVVKGLPTALGTVRLDADDGHVLYHPRFGLDLPEREPNRADLELWLKAMGDVVVHVLADIAQRRSAPGAPQGDEPAA